MHQPFYKDLISGEYRLPWTRMHALKDYYGMVRLLEEFPAIRQTFNLVPSMLVQVEEYARGEARDPFLACALKPAERLTGDERAFLLRHSFHADPTHMIYRYPRYGELLDAWEAAKRNSDHASRMLGNQDFRDLQVLSQVAWFDEEFLEHDAEVRALVTKARNFSVEDQALMGRKQIEILNRVMPAYKRLALSGQVEISTTPFYHPILPLICDSDIAGVSHPFVPLPSRFHHPEDAHYQLSVAREFVSSRFGMPPVGLWPSEGSVSDEALAQASDLGFEWAATDSGVLEKTFGHGAGLDALYSPYEWKQGDRKIKMIFRDHFMSDLIGFVYSRMSASSAAEDFLHRIRENCRGAMQTGRDALVPVILDGENAWEYYDHNGRPFLRELYRRISDDPAISAVTVSEALARVEPRVLHRIAPGSWINANFDIWIGAEEDNKAWEYLLRARQAYADATNDASSAIDEGRRKLAYEELLIAEGSDWCWWYGPEHASDNREEFDQLFRDHLANVYHALGLSPPDELTRPILKSVAAKEFRSEPTGLIHPVLDGEISSYFEWMGAGIYRADSRSGSMHGGRNPVHEIYYGTDGHDLYIRVDFAEPPAGAELRLNVCERPLAILLNAGMAELRGAAVPGAECVFRKILEIRAPVEHWPARFRVTLWRNGLPVGSVPQEGDFELARTVERS